MRRTTKEGALRGVARSGAPARRVGGGAGSPVERFVAIQRSAGNAAAVRFLKDASGAEEQRAVQRAPADGSNPTVAEQYDRMLLGSRTFQDLDSQVTAQGGPIHLDFDQEVFYHPASHSIRVKAGLAGAIRSDLLFEMNNATSRENFVHLRRVYQDELTVPGVDGELLAEYRDAALALGTEWIEWLTSVETHARAEKIDNSLGGVGGSAMPLEYANSFDIPGKKWFNFADCLEDQRRTGHTVKYDPAAGRPDWKGLVLLDLARRRNPAVLQVTQSEYWAFLVSLRRRTNKPVKDRSENPFQDRDLVLLAAAQDKPLPPTPEPEPEPAPGPESNPEPEPAPVLNEALMQAAGASARRRRRPGLS